MRISSAAEIEPKHVLTVRLAAAQTASTLSAMRIGQHDGIARLDIADCFADRLDVSRGFVSEDHRGFHVEASLGGFDIAVTERGGDDIDQELVAFGFEVLDFFQFQTVVPRNVGFGADRHLEFL